MTQGSDLRVLFGAIVGVGAGGVLLLTVVPMLGPTSARDAVPPAPTVAAEQAPAEASGPSEATDVAAPRFDTVRIAPDGSGLVAGQAIPGASVAVLAGEEVAAEVTADAEGRFVAFLDLPPSAEPRALSLRDEEGGLSQETVLVAPTGDQGTASASGGLPAPLDVALAERQVAGTTSGVTDAPGDEGTTYQGAAPPTAALPSGEEASQIAQTEEPVAAPPGMGEAARERSSEAGEGAAQGVQRGPEATARAAGSLEGADPPSGVASEVSEADASGGGEPASSIAVVAADPVSPDPSSGNGASPDVASGLEGLSPPEGETAGQSAVLLSDAEGVRVLQPALAPGADSEVLSTVALDAIAYGDEGEVTLSGRASQSGTVRLYLDNAPVAEVPVGADGQWSTALSGTESGDYTLRVDQMDAAGEVVSRIETPFRREARSDLAAAMAQAEEPGQTIAVRTVQPGNTLWAIARDRYGQPMMYVQVFEMNRDRIRDPDLIYPGQVFVLPATDGR